ncbi:MAG: type II secretion system protein [Phycisphaerales bacterium]|nr:type II secretion system protein [Planctomycetota bacterium]MCZ6811516.1 type II secretion system protein [Planctomycetota bacterium]MCZ6850815.1 type II secretion system protein [Planctomycetota bacterium]
MARHCSRHGFTMLELLVSLAVASMLLAVLLPTLSSGRVLSRRAICAGNQRFIGQAWEAYLQSNNARFPALYVQPAWHYGGVRFSSVDGDAFLDYDRPLNRFLPDRRLDVPRENVFRCPADRGITDEDGMIGTGQRSAYRAFGTSYRANAALFNAQPDQNESGQVQYGLGRDEITTAPSRLVVMGDPVWYEVSRSTGRSANWHGPPHAGNLLFLDGSVRFVTIEPRGAVGPVVFDPVAPDLAFPMRKH